VRVKQSYKSRFFFAVVLCFALVGIAVSADNELSKEDQKKFLLSAKVTANKRTKKGTTDPFRLTLTDGTTTHDGVFQAIDIHKPTMQFGDGTTEINFVDSYKYNVAAYELAELLGVDDMMPVYVERKWQGQVGSLSWLVPVKFDEADRLKQKVSAPDTDSWNKQMYRIRVFDELVYDNDPNLTNVLIGPDWKIWRVDFSRAFRLSKDVKSSNNLVKVDRKFLAAMKTLNEAELMQKTKNHLTKPEVQAVMARRDKIVAFFDKLIAQKGENEVLY